MLRIELTISDRIGRGQPLPINLYMKTISSNKAKEILVGLLKAHYPGFFRVLWKQKDGTVRWISCRLNVEKYRNGGFMPYDPLERGYLNVADVELIRKKRSDPSIKSVYRNINLSTIREIKVAGKHFIVDGIDNKAIGC